MHRVEGWYSWGAARADRVVEWLERQDPASRKGATIGWFRRFRQGDGQIFAVLLTAYLFITLIPAVIAASTYAKQDPDALADRVVDRLGLTGSTAALLREVLTGAGQNQLGATLIAIANVLLFGLGVGRVLQVVHARAWKIDLGKKRVTDQWRYLMTLLVPLVLLLLYIARVKYVSGWAGLVLDGLWFVVLAGFFVWMPRMLLRNQVTVRQVVPGALLTIVGVVGLRIVSHLLLVHWLKWYAKYYGGFGIVMAGFFWLMILATILVAAAALSPALAERRDLLQARAAPSSPVKAL